MFRFQFHEKRWEGNWFILQTSTLPDHSARPAHLTNLYCPVVFIQGDTLALGLGVPLWGSHCMANSLPPHHSFSLSSLPQQNAAAFQELRLWVIMQASPTWLRNDGVMAKLVLCLLVSMDWSLEISCMCIYIYLYIYILFIPINGLKTISKAMTFRRWWSGLKFNMFPKAWNRNLNTGCNSDTFSPKMTCKFFIGARQWKVKIHFVQPFN